MRKLILLLLICAACLYAATPSYIDVPGTPSNGWFAISYQRDGHGDGAANTYTVSYNVPGYWPASGWVSAVSLITTGASGDCAGESYATANEWGVSATWTGGPFGAPAGGFTNTSVTVTFHPVMRNPPSYDECPDCSCSSSASTSTLRLYYYSAPTGSVTGLPANYARSTEYTVAITYTDGAGASDISNMWVAFGANTSYTGCLMNWNASNSGQLMLYNGSGYAYYGNLGTGGTVLTGGICTVNTATSTRTDSGDNRTLTVKVTFTGSSPSTIYAQSYIFYAAGSRQTSWATGQTSTFNTAPVTVSSSGLPTNFNIGVEQTIVGTVRDADGYGNISYFHVLLNYGVDGGWACYFLIYPNSNYFHLLNDAADNWGSAYTFGVAGTAQNSSCKVNAATSSRSISGTDATVTLKITFLPGVFTRGGRTPAVTNSYLYVVDAASANSNWQGPYQSGTARSGPKLIVASQN